MRSTTEIILRVTLALALALAVFSAAEATAQEDPIRIGVMGPTTGPWASEGQDMLNVVIILADELNQAGGINGRKVEIFAADDGGNPKTATLATQQLIADEVVAVVGTYGSNVTEATQDIYSEAGIVQIATGSTAVRLSEKGLERFFRTCPRDDEQGKVMAQHVRDLGFKKVAIVHDNTSYSKGLANETKAIFDGSSDVEEVFFDAITPGDRDFTATLTRIKAASPDVIVFTGYYPEAALLLRQKKEMNWDIPMIGGDATNNVALVENAGEAAANGYYFISPPGPADIDTELAKKLLDVYVKKHDIYPGSIWAVLAGDAFLVIAEAVGKVGPDSKAVSDYLHDGLKNYEGLTGPISFNEKGDRLGEVYRLYQVDETGRFVLK